MADIFHYFTINAPLSKVFSSISTSQGLDRWWTKTSKGKPELESLYTLSFGPEYHWSARVTKCIPDIAFELTITAAGPDWMHTKIGCMLSHQNNITQVHFYHKGWQESNEHYRISNYCWAMYLRILKRYLEFGETVPYEDRLHV